MKRLARLVFLDIDGVLAHFGSHERLDPTCIGRLSALIEATQAQVVLTSSWRERYGLAGVQAHLEAAGFRHRLLAEAPRLPKATRSDEIVAYLAAVGDRARYVILDDVPVDERLAAKQVLVDDFVGLTEEDIALATRILG